MIEEDQKQQPKKSVNVELEECRAKCEEYLNNWKRERADFINYRKDEIKRLEEFVKFANEGIILETVEILDDLELADKHDQKDQNGYNQIVKKFADWLKKYGVEKIKVEGEKFNPELHEAVDGSDADGDEIEEIRAGYTMHDRVIRPARVKIIKK